GEVGEEHAGVITGRADERGGERTALRARQVEGDGPLALVEAGPVQAHALVGDGPALVVETATDGVEADHVGTELGKREPAERRGDEGRSLDDAQSREQPHRQSDSQRRAWVTTCVERDSSKGIRMAIARQA